MKEPTQTETPLEQLDIHLFTMERQRIREVLQSHLAIFETHLEMQAEFYADDVKYVDGEPDFNMPWDKDVYYNYLRIIPRDKIAMVHYHYGLKYWILELLLSGAEPVKLYFQPSAESYGRTIAMKLGRYSTGRLY